ncbi:MAG: NAD(P)/FAD-dependent oxidoreductase [Eubacteriales bacterium]|nr:NAD(P)/FAD-dependent oxidoreductase [Eubacteriales bacterium]
MKERYDVLIVGAGAAGLTAGAYCARAGLSTLICERAKKPGGLVNSFEHQGFSFDAGIRAFEDSGVIVPMLRSLGITLEFVKNPVTIGIADRRVPLVGKESLRDTADLYKAFFPGESAQIDAIMDEIVKVMRYMDVLYGVENPLFLQNEWKDPQYLGKTLLPWLIRYLFNIRKADRLDEPVRRYLKRFTQNESLIDMVCQHFFAETPTFFALSYFGLYLDYRYPVGGTSMLIRKLAESVLARGGELITDSAVTRVQPDDHLALLANGSVIRYRQLVWAADQTALYRALNGPLSNKSARRRELVERSHGIDSVLTLFLGTSIPPQEAEAVCGAHAFYTPVTTGLSTLPDWHSLRCEGIGAIRDWVVSYLERTTYEISIPALRDASLAPEGKTGIITSTLFDYDLVKYFSDAGEYPSFKALAQETILRVLSASVLPGLNERIVCALCSTPMTIERETGERHGAITGWAHTNHPTPAVNRFSAIKKAIETDLPDVLQCGMWTFSPGGLPVSIITGKLAADEAARRFAKRRKRA